MFMDSDQTASGANSQGSPVALGHNGAGVGISVKPQAAGIGITGDGNKLVVANYYNDSISVLTKSPSGWTVSAELDLGPGKRIRKNPESRAANIRYGSQSRAMTLRTFRAFVIAKLWW